MKNKKIIIIFFLITLLWILMILFLSSQNGSKTASTSSPIAQKLCSLIYNSPTQEQLDNLHMIIRKSAHVFLFLTLGLLTTLSLTSLTNKSKSKYFIISIIAAFTFSSLIGFIDEWHKQFIVGRHFDKGEALLNILCSLVGVALTALILKIKEHKSSSDKTVQ